MTQRRCTSFFKILLDPSAPHLPLPPDFAKTHLEKRTPKYSVIRSAKGGYLWKLKIKKIGESFCFSNGWDSVVKDINLGFGDFLVFRFDHKSTFKLVVYSPNGCEKDFPPKIKILDLDDDVVDDVKEEDVIVDDDDDDDDDNDVDVVVKVHVDEDEDEDEDEFEDEDEDEDEDEEGYEEVKDDEEDEDDDEGDGEGGIDGHDGDPFFMLVLSKTNKNIMRLPLDFVELAGIEEGTLTMANLDGKEWQMGVRFEKSHQTERYCISAGWRDFRRSNDLCEGDECVFKFIRSEEKLLLARVTKKKRAVNDVVKKKKREQRVRNSDEVPATGVKKRKMGRAARDGDGGVEVKRGDECVEVVKRPRGRPPRQK